MRRNADGGSDGFSLVELLVVIGIIGLLLAILLPVLATVRHMARSTVCLSHLQQMGDSYRMYVNASGGHSFDTSNDITRPSWWERLQPYNGSIQAMLLCPEATEPGNAIGSATMAWGPERTYSVGGPKWVLRGEYIGSYGLNTWLYEVPGDLRATVVPAWLIYPIHMPAKQPDLVPVFADCIMSFGGPMDTDSVPASLVHPLPFYSGVGQRPAGPSGQMAYFCIDRHRRAINVIFLDGHAARVPLPDLWKLRWNNIFKPRDVVVP